MAAAPSPEALPGLAVLEQTPIIIEKIVHSASDEQMHWKPSAERWSISEVLAHLADVEVIGFRERVDKMMNEKDP
ncbi:MAG: DinB family protein, partial [Candidatus Acidiferrales bacterium]